MSVSSQPVLSPSLVPESVSETVTSPGFTLLHSGPLVALFYAVDDSELGALDYKVIPRLNEKLTRVYNLWPALDFTAGGRHQPALWPGAQSVRRDSKPGRGCVMK